MNMRAGVTVGIALTAACAFAGTKNANGVYVLDDNEVLHLTNATVGDYAGGIQFKGKNSVVEFDTTAAPSMTLESPNQNTNCTVRKVNDAPWTITKEQSKFWGTYEINGGIVTVDVESAFGYIWEKLPVIVKPGAMITASTAYDQRSRVFHISGTGVDNRGVIELKANMGATCIDRVVLEDDALVKVSGSHYWFLNDLDPNGHVLTVDCKDVYNYGPLGTGGLRLVRDGGSTYYHRDGAAKVTDDPEGKIVLASPSGVAAYCFMGPVTNTTVARPFELQGKTKIYAELDNNSVIGLDTNHYCFTEGLAFAEGAPSSWLVLTTGHADDQTTTRGYKTQFSFLGPISGAGSVFANGWYFNGRIYLANEHNTFTGSFGIAHGSSDVPSESEWESDSCRGTVLAAYPGSIGGDGTSYSHVSVQTKTATGGLLCEVSGNEEKWDYAHFRKLAAEATWTDSAFPLLHPTGKALPELNVEDGLPTQKWGATGEVAFNFATAADAENFQWWCGVAHLRCLEPLTLKGLTLNAGVHYKDGDVPIRTAVVLSGGTTVEVGKTQLPLTVAGSPASYAAIPHVVVTNASIVQTEPIPDAYEKAYDYMLGIGADKDHNDRRCVLDVCAGAVVSNKLAVGGTGLYTDTDGVDSGYGAVHQFGGKVYSLGNKGEAYLDSGVGIGGRGTGSYNLWGGEFHAVGNFTVGGYSQGSWTQYGGTSVFDKYQNGGSFGVGAMNGGKGSLTVFGGEMTVNMNANAQGCYQSNGAAALAVVGPTAKLTVNGTVNFSNGSGNSNYPCTVAVADGGVLGVQMLGQHPDSDDYARTLYVGFDGGVLKTTGSAEKIFRSGSDAPTAVTVYGRGLTVDTDGNDGNTIDCPIVAATGGCVTAIPLEAPLTSTKTLGSPVVWIEGDGQGAAAAAVFDPDTGAVTELRVTSPGFGYTCATAVVQNAKWKIPCTIGTNDSTGSFTKRGAGTLTLNATNTWGGALTVAGGTLKCGCEEAIPNDRGLTLAGGGVLDLNGKPVTIRSVTMGAGGGSIVNAQNATLPGTFTASLSVEDLIAGRPLRFVGDVDLSTMNFTLTGDLTLLDTDLHPEIAECRFTVFETTGGTLSNIPDIPELAAAPKWTLAKTPQKAVLRIPKGLLLLFR